MNAKEKAISLLNSNMKFTYDCATMEQKCGLMNCPYGVCKAAILDAKRISVAMCDELIDNYSADFEGEGRVYLKSYHNHIRNYYIDVKNEIENI